MGKSTSKEAVRLVEKGPQLEILINSKVYPLDAVLSAAYAFIDKGYFLVDKEGKDYFKVIVAAKPGVGEEVLKEIAGEFENQLLSEALRARIAKRTAKIRDTIVGAALAYAMERGQEELPEEEDLEDLPPEVLEVLKGEDEDLDFLEDPLNIAVPWEEKYQKKDEDE